MVQAPSSTCAAHLVMIGSSKSYATLGPPGILHAPTQTERNPFYKHQNPSMEYKCIRPSMVDWLVGSLVGEELAS